MVACVCYRVTLFITVEVVIKLLKSGLTAFSIHTNVLKVIADTLKDELQLGGGIRHFSYIAVSRAQQTNSCLRK